MATDKTTDNLERAYIEGWVLALVFATEEEARAGRWEVAIWCGVMSVILQAIVGKWVAIKALLGPRFSSTAGLVVTDFRWWVCTLGVFLLVVTFSPFVEQQRWPFTTAINTPVAPTTGEASWLVPLDAVNKFVPADILADWHRYNGIDSKEGSIADERVRENLRQQLLSGNLVARGNPHIGVASDNKPIEINPAQWQTLKLAGPGFSSAASSVGPTHSYDNVEIRESPTYVDAEELNKAIAKAVAPIQTQLETKIRELTETQHNLEIAQGKLAAGRAQTAIGGAEVASPPAQPAVSVPGTGNVVSFGQSGGVTAGTVINQKAPARVLNEASRIKLLSMLPAGTQKISISSVSGDLESARLAKQIEDFLRSKGFDVGGGNSNIYAGVPPTGVTVPSSLDSNGIEQITVGLNDSQ